MSWLQPVRASTLALALVTALAPAAKDAGADSLPQSLLDDALAGNADELHPLIENHLKSQLDWRTYYLNRADVRARSGAAPITPGQDG